MTLTVTLLGFGQIDDAENSGTWEELGATLGVVDDDNVFIEQTQAISTKASGSSKDGWLYFLDGTPRSLSVTYAGQHIYMWLMITTVGGIDTVANGGIRLQIGSGGSGSTDTKSFTFLGKDIGERYNGGKQGWICLVIDTSKTGSYTGGSIDQTIVDCFGAYINMVGSSRAENLVIDAIYVANGVRAIGSDTNGWDDIADYCTDYGSRAWGMVQKEVGGITVWGKITIGDTTQVAVTSLIDKGKTITFGKMEYYVSAAFANSIADDFMGIDLEDAASYITTYQDGELVDGTNGIGGSGTLFVGSELHACYFDMSGLTNAGSIVKLYGSIIKNFTTRVKLSDDVDHHCYSVTFDGNTQVDPVGAIKIRNSIFQNYVETLAAFKWISGVDIQNCSFLNNADITNDPAGIQHPTAGTFTYTNLVFSGNDFDILNSVEASQLTIASVGGTDHKIGNGTIIAAGQSFLGTATVLSRAIFRLREIGSATGNAVCKLYLSTGSDPNRVPTGAALATSEVVDVSTIGTSYVDVDFEFKDEFTMSAVNYFIVIEYVGDVSNHIEVDANATGATYASNNFASNTGSWAAIDDDADFSINTGGIVKINASGTSNPTNYRNDATVKGATIIINSKTLTITNLKVNSQVVILDAADNSELDAVEDSGTSFQYSYNFGTDPTDIVIAIDHIDYVYERFAYSVTASDAILPQNQRTERNYKT